MKKNQKYRLSAIIGLIVLVGAMVFSVSYDSESYTPEKSETKEQTELLFSNLQKSIFEQGDTVYMNSVYATGDCAQAITLIKEAHWKAVQKPMSWYGAGLVLGMHYVEQDCDTAKGIMDEILADLWTAQKEYSVDRGVIDDISAGIRFVKNVL